MQYCTCNFQKKKNANKKFPIPSKEMPKGDYCVNNALHKIYIYLKLFSFRLCREENVGENPPTLLYETYLQTHPMDSYCHLKAL